MSTVSKRIKLEMQIWVAVLTNDSYLGIILEYFTIKEFLKIITVCKYYSEFLNDKKRNYLVKRLVSYDYGKIWTTYEIKLPFKNLKNLEFINKLYNDFDFIQNSVVLSTNLCKFSKYLVNCLRCTDRTLITAPLFGSFSKNIVILAPLGNYNCIKYWMEKKKVTFDNYLFVFLSKYFDFTIDEFKQQLNGLTFPTDLSYYNLLSFDDNQTIFGNKIFYDFKRIFFEECINMSRKKKITNGIQAIFLKLTENQCIFTPTYDGIHFMFKCVFLLVTGKYLPCNINSPWIGFLSSNYLLEQNNLSSKFMISIEDNETIMNLKYVIKELLKIGQAYISEFSSMIKKSYYITQKMDILIFNDKQVHKKIQDFLIHCLEKS